MIGDAHIKILNDRIVYRGETIFRGRLSGKTSEEIEDILRRCCRVLGLPLNTIPSTKPKFTIPYILAQQTPQSLGQCIDFEVRNSSWEDDKMLQVLESRLNTLTSILSTIVDSFPNNQQLELAELLGFEKS